jgi:hypothetical protein
MLLWYGFVVVLLAEALLIKLQKYERWNFPVELSRESLF